MALADSVKREQMDAMVARLRDDLAALADERDRAIATARRLREALAPFALFASTAKKVPEILWMKPFPNPVEHQSLSYNTLLEADAALAETAWLEEEK